MPSNRRLKARSEKVGDSLAHLSTALPLGEAESGLPVVSGAVGFLRI